MREFICIPKGFCKLFSTKKKINFVTQNWFWLQRHQVPLATPYQLEELSPYISCKPWRVKKNSGSDQETCIWKGFQLFSALLNFGHFLYKSIVYFYNGYLLVTSEARRWQIKMKLCTEDGIGISIMHFWSGVIALCNNHSLLAILAILL